MSEASLARTIDSTGKRAIRGSHHAVHYLLLCCFLVLCAVVAHADEFNSHVGPLVESSCLHCHDAGTDTRLDFETLDHDLSDAATFRMWEKVLDRVSRGEMPPASEDRPHLAQVAEATGFLKKRLTAANLTAQQTNGRVPFRRLTRKEYEYTLHDLLAIRCDLAKHLPPENSSSSFDTVAEAQGISPVHIRSYLAAADVALDEAIQLGPRPSGQPVEMKYRTHSYTTMWLERPLRRGGSTVKLVDDAWVTFDDRPHVAQSDNMGYRPPYPGLYRIRAEAYGYQAKTPVTMLLYRGSKLQGGAELIGSFDLPPGKPRTVEVTHYFTPDDFFYPAPADHDWQADGRNVFAGLGAKNYKGEGLAVRWLKIEGPLEQQWPPESTWRLLEGVNFKPNRNEFQLRPWQSPVGQPDAFAAELTKSPQEHLENIIHHIGRLAFRRPLKQNEAAGFVRLAEPSLSSGEPLDQAVRVPLRAMFSSPQFVMHAGKPGQLDDYALATRLSYFLWKSLPDEELFSLASEAKLHQSEVLAGQVDRLLADPKSDRFVHDFLDQWLGLADIDATTPDENLYPEYDDVLRQAMLAETRHFFRELISQNLSSGNLIDSDFTFLNHRLTEHYGIELSSDVESSVFPQLADGSVASDYPMELMRRVSFPLDSVRGGLVTQASVLKVTANGTVTSPVKRGSFVLSKLLGTPPSPPPPNVGSVEPDTRGTTTIRDTLDAHRNVETCANCHKHIDPPGFALECFDPIGGFRLRYRTTGKGDWSSRKIFGRQVYEYKEGPPVDASGVTADGKAFRGIRQFKQHLMGSKEQVARNLISQLVVYATGGEIQFADRDQIEQIVRETGKRDFPVRNIIHKVVQSRMFRNK